ncbi:type II toxin-antitoxin system PemK/MazF family toxin [Dapis sp. BLCC M229]|uniref:type II toxin-antitoxin system PemK/MazF family toxin n=1 Tax=Dapis sp. BLCC M229 TaxID=3400188 RepID=UPI003CEA4301
MWLVRFPFSDLTSTKVRLALILAVHREEVIILGIFSKITNSNLPKNWVLMSEENSNFLQTGLKKTSLIRADKIATVSNSVFHKKIGDLPSEIFVLVQEAVKKSLNIP